MATMVKRLKKNPEDGESQPPIEGEAELASGDGWDAQQQATVTAYAKSRGDAASGGVAGSCQLDGKDPAQRERRKPG